MKKYKLYLFDLDGTLLDSDPMIIETFKDLYKKYKPKDFEPSIERMLSFSGPPIRETLKQEFPELDQEPLLLEWRDKSVANYPKYTKLYPGALELLKHLKDKGIHVAIVTNKHRAATDSVFKLFGFDKLDIYSICGDEVKQQKPNPDGVYKCMSYFGIQDKKDVIYIGDSKYDLLTSKNAGVDFGFVTWSPRKFEKNTENTVEIDNYSDFARAI